MSLSLSSLCHCTKNFAPMAVTVKPVRTRPICHHGLFGSRFVKQHLLFDNRWTTQSISVELWKMTQLLRQRLNFNNLDKTSIRQKLTKRLYGLRQQCHNGRIQMQNILTDSNTTEIRNLMVNNKELQRLYQKMPLDEIVQNINERTFKMRKDRDRLIVQLRDKEQKYSNALMEMGYLENKEIYGNGAIEQLQLQEYDLMKRIVNSRTRLSANKTIYATYKKMKQTLEYDQIFFEPILRSLDEDLIDQANFIKHILWLGSPAITKFKDLTEEYKKRDETTRKTTQRLRLTFQGTIMKQRQSDGSFLGNVHRRDRESKVNIRKYIRETNSMVILRQQCQEVESAIKKMKVAILRSHALELYPQIKNIFDNNYVMHKTIEKQLLGHAVLETKVKSANILEKILRDNTSEDKQKRLDRINHLQTLIKLEDDTQEFILSQMKFRSEAYVLIKFSMWNLNEILRFVKPVRAAVPKYPTPELNLPLLKFETFNMRSVPPEPYEQNIVELIKTVHRKLKILLKGLRNLRRIFAEDDDDELPTIQEIHKEYIGAIMESIDFDNQMEPSIDIREGVTDELREFRQIKKIPSRKDIKMFSARIVDEAVKKDE